MNELELIDPQSEDLKFVEKQFVDIQKELLEINQIRSDFQLVHFVVQRHGPLTAGAGHRQRYQALREMQIMRGEIGRQVIRRERLKREIETLKSQLNVEDPTRNNCDLDLAEKTIEISDIDLNVQGLLREYKTLSDILKTLPTYSFEEFQKMEPQYWRQRLERQLLQSRDSALSGFDRGDLESIAQAADDELLPGTGRIEQVGFQVPGVTKLPEAFDKIALEGNVQNPSLLD
jgi:hypothetical protein